MRNCQNCGKKESKEVFFLCSDCGNILQDKLLDIHKFFKILDNNILILTSLRNKLKSTTVGSSKDLLSSQIDILQSLRKELKDEIKHD